MQIKSIGIDLRNPPFTLIGAGNPFPGSNPQEVLSHTATGVHGQLPSSLIGMEAGVGSHFWDEPSANRGTSHLWG